MRNYKHIDSEDQMVREKVNELTPQVLRKLREIQGDASGLDYIAFMSSSREGQVRQVLRALFELDSYTP